MSSDEPRPDLEEWREKRKSKFDMENVEPDDPRFDLQWEIIGAYQYIDQLEQELEEVRQERDELRGTLRFYADGKHYEVEVENGRHTCWCDYTKIKEVENGLKARKILSDGGDCDERLDI